MGSRRRSVRSRPSPVSHERWCADLAAADPAGSPTRTASSAWRSPMPCTLLQHVNPNSARGSTHRRWRSHVEGLATAGRSPGFRSAPAGPQLRCDLVGTSARDAVSASDMNGVEVRLVYRSTDRGRRGVCLADAPRCRVVFSRRCGWLQIVRTTRGRRRRWRSWHFFAKRLSAGRADRTADVFGEPTSLRDGARSDPAHHRRGAHWTTIKTGT